MRKSAKQLVKGGEFAEELVEDIEFCDFVLREAERTIVHASVEDLAIFGFGKLEDAIESYQEYQREKQKRV